MRSRARWASARSWATRPTALPRSPAVTAAGSRRRSSSTARASRAATWRRSRPSWRRRGRTSGVPGPRRPPWVPDLTIAQPGRAPVAPRFRRPDKALPSHANRHDFALDGWLKSPMALLGRGCRVTTGVALLGLVLALMPVATGRALAQSAPSATKSSIIVEGNRRVEADTVRSYFKPSPGGKLDPAAIDRALK